MGRKRLNLEGRKFGRLTVISFSHINKYSQACWNCLCDCGKEKTIIGNYLKRGSTKSCGCLYKKHGMEGTPIYRVWGALKHRCYIPKNARYKNYGGRGIKVCKRWLNSFENFYKDMGDRPKGKSIERINNDGNYTPKNCKWATQKEQQNNRSNNHRITVKGEAHTLSDWERIKKYKRNTIYQRINRNGWSSEKAVMTKVRKMKKVYKC